MRAPQRPIRNAPTVVGKYFRLELDSEHAVISTYHPAGQPIVHDLLIAYEVTPQLYFFAGLKLDARHSTITD
ncbi:MAG: hypothetical protein ACT4QE_11865 [Anaerolineales bacterium]